MSQTTREIFLFYFFNQNKWNLVSCKQWSLATTSECYKRNCYRCSMFLAFTERAGMYGKRWNIWYIYVLIWVKMWSRILWVGGKSVYFYFLNCVWSVTGILAFSMLLIWQFSWIFTKFTVLCLIYLIFPLSGCMYTFKSIIKNSSNGSTSLFSF